MKAEDRERERGGEVHEKEREGGRELEYAKTVVVSMGAVAASGG